MRLNDWVQVSEEIDEGCYKCPQIGDKGVVTTLEQGRRDLLEPWIGVRFPGHERYGECFFTEEELTWLGTTL